MLVYMLQVSEFCKMAEFCKVPWFQGTYFSGRLLEGHPVPARLLGLGRVVTAGQAIN